MSDDGKTLHDCFDCKGCICEEYCAEEEEKHFGKNKVKKANKENFEHGT